MAYVFGSDGKPIPVVEGMEGVYEQVQREIENEYDAAIPEMDVQDYFEQAMAAFDVDNAVDAAELERRRRVEAMEAIQADVLAAVEVHMHVDDDMALEVMEGAASAIAGIPAAGAAGFPEPQENAEEGAAAAAAAVAVIVKEMETPEETGKTTGENDSNKGSNPKKEEEGSDGENSDKSFQELQLSDSENDEDGPEEQESGNEEEGNEQNEPENNEGEEGNESGIDEGAEEIRRAIWDSDPEENENKEEEEQQEAPAENEEDNEEAPEDNEAENGGESGIEEEPQGNVSENEEERANEPENGNEQGANMAVAVNAQGDRGLGNGLGAVGYDAGNNSNGNANGFGRENQNNKAEIVTWDLSALGYGPHMKETAENWCVEELYDLAEFGEMKINDPRENGLAFEDNRREEDGWLLNFAANYFDEPEPVENNEMMWEDEEDEACDNCKDRKVGPSSTRPRVLTSRARAASAKAAKGKKGMKKRGN